MTMYSLFLRCLNITYTHIEGDGSYASEKIGDTLYLYFEKSNGKNDWKTNLNFPVKTHRGYLAHRGFVRVWESLAADIHKIVKDSACSKITVTGYSHGGALALLCHEYILSVFPAATVVGYGFGTPRVVWGFLGNKRHRWDNFTVIRNIDDIVTHLPPAFLGYRHMGNLITVGQRGKYSSIDAHREENILRELKLVN